MIGNKLDRAGALLTGLLLVGPLLYVGVSVKFCSKDVLSPGGNFCDICSAYCPMFMAWSVPAIVLLLGIGALSYWRYSCFKRGKAKITSPIFWVATAGGFFLFQLAVGLLAKDLGPELLANARKGMAAHSTAKPSAPK